MLNEKSIKVSVISTVKNEERTIRELIDTLFSQTRLPDEVIIVDAGSTDRTVPIIRSYVEKGYPIKLIIEKGANISRGLNISVENASFDIIACTHAGCRLDKRWLEKIVQPFLEDKNVEVVAGWYEADAKTDFEKIIAAITCPQLAKVLKKPDKYIPPSRSIAFRKHCWEKVGGFPEWLRSAEDTYFAIMLKKNNCKFFFNPEAKVYWKVSSNLSDFFKRYYFYAVGDGQARLFLKRYFLLLALYILGTLLFLMSIYFKSIELQMVLIFLVAAYFLKDLIKVKNAGYNNIRLRSLFWLFFVRISLDISRIIGFLAGLRKGKSEKRIKIASKIN